MKLNDVPDSNFPPPTDENDEEDVLDEEAQLMANMGLPLAFASSSDHRRKVMQSCFFLVEY